MSATDTDTLLLEASKLMSGDRSLDELARLHSSLLPDLTAEGYTVRVPRGWILSERGAERLLALASA